MPPPPPTTPTKNLTEAQGSLKSTTSENLTLKTRVAELDRPITTKAPISSPAMLFDRHSAVLDDVPTMLAACKEQMLKSCRFITSTEEKELGDTQEKYDTSAQQEAKSRVELEEMLRTFWGTKEVKWQESVHKLQNECRGLLGKWEKEWSKLKAQEEENRVLERRMEDCKIENERLRAENNQLVKRNSDLGIVIIERDHEIQGKNDEIRMLVHQRGVCDGEISALNLEIADFKERFEKHAIIAHNIHQDCEHMYDEIQDDFEGLKDEIMVMKDENHALKDDLLYCKKEYQNLQNTVLRREESILDRNAEISRLGRRFGQLLEKTNTMKEENDTLKEEKDHLEDELKPLRDEKRWMEADILRREEDIRNKDAEIAANAAEINRLQAQFEYTLTGHDPRWELKDWELESASEEDESDEEKKGC